MIPDFFMLPGPEDQLGEDRSEIDALARELVNLLSPIGFIRPRGNNTVRLQPLQAVRKDVGGDPLGTFQELFKGVRLAEHHVTEDQQRPAIAEDLD